MIKLFTASLLSIFILLSPSISVASSIISGISTNEINIDTKFNGAEILLFGAKDDSHASSDLNTAFVSMAQMLQWIKTSGQK